MRLLFIKILVLIFPIVIFSQKEFHVFPSNHKITHGDPSGNGSLGQPWDLHTALKQSSDIINGGDTIWLHEGTYAGRFISVLNGTKENAQIVVDVYKGEKVVLNGNIESKRTSVLEVRGKNVTFKNFEITFMGEFSRKSTDANFKVVSGLDHVSGVNCQFINLKIHNNPGSGFGSWKRTGGSLIYGCTIFNNGYFSIKRGSGVGMYVQNESNKIRIIKNNIIFNNYYKGIEIWSASKNAKSEYVKNITLDNNIIFNNGLPAGRFRDNLIVGTNDKNDVNLAKNISIKNNIFYHNTDIGKNQVGGDAPSLTLGFNPVAPLENVSVTKNIIIGRNNALRFNNARSLEFRNNIAYCGYVHLNKSVLHHIKKWKFSNNIYYTKRNVPFRISKHKDYKLEEWQAQFPIDQKSEWKHISEFNLPGNLSITQNEYEKTKFRVVVFSKDGTDVEIDMSDFKIKEGQQYNIKNIETEEVISSGKLNSQSQIKISPGEYNQTRNNFGVYTIKLESQEEIRTSFFKRLFSWLF